MITRQNSFEAQGYAGMSFGPPDAQSMAAPGGAAWANANWASYGMVSLFSCQAFFRSQVSCPLAAASALSYCQARAQ